jgi:hypothetical protein
MKLYIDIDTGECRRTLTGPKVASLVFYLRDILNPLQISFTQDGTIVTATVLAASAVMRLGLKAGIGGSLLAGASTYTLNGDTAEVEFSLNTSELIAYFTSNVPPGAREGNFLFEVETTNAGGTERETRLQEVALVRRDVNTSDDVNPTSAEEGVYVLRGELFDDAGDAISPKFPAFRSAITGRTGGGATNLDGISTASLTIPFLVILVIAGTAEIWQLAAGTDAEADPFVIRPDDYNALTNARVWKRVL